MYSLSQTHRENHSETNCPVYLNHLTAKWEIEKATGGGALLVNLIELKPLSSSEESYAEKRGAQSHCIDQFRF